MKAIRATLIAQLIAMYLMHLPLYIVMILIQLQVPDETAGPLIRVLIILSLVLIGLAFPLCVVNAVLSIVSIFKGEYSPSKTTMVVKLALIPWYVLNFLISFMVIGGLLNPWLFLGAPIVMGLLASFTYLFMAATSLPDIGFFFNRFARKKVEVTGVLVTGMVFLCFFCLDIVGAIMFHLGMKKAIKQ